MEKNKGIIKRLVRIEDDLRLRKIGIDKLKKGDVAIITITTETQISKLVIRVLTNSTFLMNKK